MTTNTTLQLDFGITAEELVQINESKNVELLNTKYGGVEGIAKLLHTDLKEGISATEVESGMEQRIEQ